MGANDFRLVVPSPQTKFVVFQGTLLEAMRFIGRHWTALQLQRLETRFGESLEISRVLKDKITFRFDVAQDQIGDDTRESELAGALCADLFVSDCAKPVHLGEGIRVSMSGA